MALDIARLDVSSFTFIRFLSIFLVNLAITHITLLIDQAYNIIWISFVVDEVIFNTKLESILLAKSFSKADVSKYKVFFQKIIHVYWVILYKH